MVIVYIFCTRLHRILTGSMKDTGRYWKYEYFSIFFLPSSILLTANRRGFFPTPPTNHSSRYDDSAPATPGPLPRIASSTSQSEIPTHPPRKLTLSPWKNYGWKIIWNFWNGVDFQGTSQFKWFILKKFNVEHVVPQRKTYLYTSFFLDVHLQGS